MIITIDGPVAAGKTTVARRLARQLGWIYLDTGAIYRCLALAARQQGVAWNDQERLAQVAASLSVGFVPGADSDVVLLDETDVSSAIRTPEISRGASIVSALPAVRSALLDLQRAFAASRNIVAEGRDTGTVVFPEAAFKVFLTAASEVRARRRYRELVHRGHDTSPEEVFADLESRDLRDSTRSTAPLEAAPEALVVDSSEMDVGQVVNTILDHMPTSRSPR